MEEEDADDESSGRVLLDGLAAGEPGFRNQPPGNLEPPLFKLLAFSDVADSLDVTPARNL